MIIIIIIIIIITVIIIIIIIITISTSLTFQNLLEVAINIVPFIVHSAQKNAF